MPNPSGREGSGPTGGSDSDNGQQRPRSVPHPKVLFLLAAIVALVVLFSSQQTETRSDLTYRFFLDQLDKGSIASLTAQGQVLLGEFKKDQAPKDPNPKQGEKAKPLNQKFRVVMPSKDTFNELTPELRAKDVDFKVDEPTDNTGLLVFTYLIYVLVPVAFFVAIYFMFRRTRDQLSGGGILGNFNKSPAKRYESDRQRITFNDVAGLHSVKQELEEVVEFLKNPQKFQRLGGRIPKGTLLVGSPGTGKTLLAKAVAGEAGVPFYSINGSEFIQMFVGVGASRVRDLFRTAKESSPAIVFIDEIDAVGRVRGAGFGGGHDEREQTLNQILSEMDGFSPNESVIVIAASNRPDVLDPALLRPGRFDRHITVDRPTLKGRIELFKVHTRNVPLSDNVDLERLAGGTIGMTGADIRNLVNEAALWATRQDKDAVEMDDFEHARDKVLMGPKREELLSEREKETTAYHEAGHALLAWVVPEADRVHKVTVVPRGRALGVTMFEVDEERLNVKESEIQAKLVGLLGGRASEKLVYDQYSAGAENDLQQATRIARRMVTHWGMSERLGPVAYRTSEEHPFLGKEYTEQREFSEHTAQVIDEEVARILRSADQRAQELLSEHRGDLEKLARGLIEEEVLEESDIEALIGPSVNKPPVSEVSTAALAPPGSA